jgi:predicted ATPase
MDVSAALAEQLLALVAEQCAVAPTILVIDDLQWADQATITLWGRLARSVRRMPLRAHALQPRQAGDSRAAGHHGPGGGRSGG